jgi:hypothetical protein
VIRLLESNDLPRLRELQNEFEWTFAPDYMLGLAVVDENNLPVMMAGAWKRAEVHLVADSQLGSPQDREAAFLELHEAMANTLANQGVAEVITWMDDMQAFGRRLKRLGWDVAKRTTWARRIF